MYGIYKITNLTNNKSYIGKSSNIEERFKYHKYNYQSFGKDWNKTLYKAFRKYGLNNFSFDIIEEMTKDEYDKFSNNREQYWIQYYDSFENGYNETKGGEGGFIPRGLSSTKKLTEEEVLNIRELYETCEIGFSDAYALYQDKISRRGFRAIWSGQNWKHIKPEVFTEENKKKHDLLEGKRRWEIGKENTNL